MRIIGDITLLATLAIIWLIPVVLVAWLAERRGYSFATVLVVALTVPWLIVLLVVSIMQRRGQGSLAKTNKTDCRCYV